VDFEKLGKEKLVIDKERFTKMIERFDDSIFDGDLSHEYGMKPVNRYDTENPKGYIASNSITHHHVTVSVSKDYQNEGLFRVQTSINSSTAYTTKAVPLHRIKEAKALHEARIDYATAFAMTVAPKYVSEGQILELPPEESGKGMSAALTAILKERGLIR
jgi:hypothetical protein